MNWGFRISTLYIGFVVMILVLTGLTMRENVDLVSADYYEQELLYQDRIDRISRTQNLANKLTWNLGEKKISLLFPLLSGKDKIKGTVLFFRPSDASLDKTTAIETDSNGLQEIALDKLIPGYYKMQVTWDAGAEEFYNEGVVQIR